MLPYLSLSRFRGKVEEYWFEMDLLGLMGQLGAIPEPEQSEEGSPTSSM
jgi:hypothetical protein